MSGGAQGTSRDRKGRSGLPSAVFAPLARAALVAFLMAAALLAWSATAELATTFRVPGSMRADHPVHDVQTLEGGRVAEVLRGRFDRVRAGEALVRFDDARARATAAAVAAQIAMARAELRAIHRLLRTEEDAAPAAPAGEGAVLPFAVPSDLAASVEAEIQALAAEHAREIAGLEARMAAARAQLDPLQRQHRARKAALALAQVRSDRIARLVGRGAATAEQADAAETRRLDLVAELASLEARMSALEGELSSLTAERARLEQAFRSNLAGRARAAHAQLIELEARARILKRQLSDTVLRAPADGELSFFADLAPGAVLPPGGLVARITAPARRMMVDLRVAPNQIDQIRPGQTGLLTIPALPQRQMPRIHVTVTGIAEAVEGGGEDGALHFRARAEVNEADLAAARRALGPAFRIVPDMPVIVALDGPPTTPLDFFLGPVEAMVANGFQQGN